MTDTYEDGGGVLKDQPLTKGTIIRFVPDPNDRARDITVSLSDGEVRVSGSYRRLVVRQVQPHVISISTPEATL